mmetsp:Transcript_111621/g.315221  ORF Transcript_111621/g.315221 Transcript_111621/m.315221 type:complete len:396 (-) Transcript_111621:7-1194(-)
MWLSKMMQQIEYTTPKSIDNSSESNSSLNSSKNLRIRPIRAILIIRENRSTRAKPADCDRCKALGPASAETQSMPTMKTSTGSHPFIYRRHILLGHITSVPSLSMYPTMKLATMSAVQKAAATTSSVDWSPEALRGKASRSGISTRSYNSTSMPIPVQHVHRSEAGCMRRRPQWSLLQSVGAHAPSRSLTESFSSSIGTVRRPASAMACSFAFSRRLSDSCSAYRSRMPMVSWLRLAALGSASALLSACSLQFACPLAVRGAGIATSAAAFPSATRLVTPAESWCFDGVSGASFKEPPSSLLPAPSDTPKWLAIAVSRRSWRFAFASCAWTTFNISWYSDCMPSSFTVGRAGIGKYQWQAWDYPVRRKNAPLGERWSTCWIECVRGVRYFASASS